MAAPLQQDEPQLGALQLAKTVLCTGDPVAKSKAAHDLRAFWLKTRHVGTAPDSLPDQPARPAKPVLVPPKEVPRRRLGSPEGRGALLHAIAHIEINAIDLAADMVARFGSHPDIAEADRGEFIDDWTRICEDEARHFNILSARLGTLGLNYGDHVAHNGLWEAAQSTRHNFAARIAIAPLVLEARGLDVTPGMIVKFNNIKDVESAQLLQTIYDEEIDHVRSGAKWFQYLARHHNKEPKSWFQQLVREYFDGHIKSPFNETARSIAGLSRDYYLPLAHKTS